MEIINDIKQDTVKAIREVISTEFYRLNALIGGWHNGELVLIGGRPPCNGKDLIHNVFIDKSVCCE